jgi:3-hydroxyisobutyrate dehydrogenase-like beta-hydroxyacid dehydrogenase
MKLAFLGLGQMGAGIAANLVAAGHEVHVWNRSPEKTAPIVAAGAIAAATPREAAEGAEVAFTMLADDQALLQVLEGVDGLLAGLPRDATHVSQSTIAVATADRVAALHAEQGQRFVSAPVFGRPAAAAAAKLWIVAAGEPATLDEVTPLFDVIGRAVHRVGERPSAANLVKLAGNFMIMASVEAMGESLALAESGGVARGAMLAVLTGTLFTGPFYEIYGPMVVEQRFRPAGFTAPLGLKDMRLAGEAAEANGLALPVLEIVKAHMADTIAREGSDIDVAALVTAIGRG